MKSSYKSEEWEQLIADYRSSGLSAKIWCEQKQISVYKLRYHITRLNKKQLNQESKDQWVSLPLKQQIEEQSISSSPIILKIGSITMELSAGFDKNVLLDVLSVVENYDRHSQL